jgi:ribonuclease VapC
MIVDTSAIVAVLRQEPDAETFVKALFNAPKSYITAPTYLELVMVITGGRPAPAAEVVDLLLHRLKIEVIPFSADMARVAAQALFDYGKGRNHKAQLNFGDCISYAASKVEVMPLLFKGQDFRLTDVECAV